MARVLIIEHDTTTRAMMTDLLKSAGHEIRSTDSSWNAFTLCHLMAMDVVIVCLFMPGHTGAEALRDLRREFPELAILAFASRPSVEDVSEFALWLGATRTLKKPCEPDVLLATVEDVLRSRLEKNGSGTMPLNAGSVPAGARI
jgi:DNA-binding response OmpR family regulator